MEPLQIFFLIINIAALICWPIFLFLITKYLKRIERAILRLSFRAIPLRIENQTSVSELPGGAKKSEESLREYENWLKRNFGEMI